MRPQYFRGNLFVANLPPELTEDELAEAFDPYGIVLSAAIARDPESGKRLRYGFVDIATERAAKLAVERMNGTNLDGHNLDVRISERPAKVKRPAAARAANRHPAPRRREVDEEPAASAGPRPGSYRGDDEQDAAAVFTTPPRRRPTFQVERRSLPRRAP
jgi:RNA recognition motif-containing protein